MAPAERPNTPCDIFIIGGGVNGCGIARDAAGRGMRVVLAEQGDLAQATSSASTKLFHGGLRYLEFYKFRLVREALIERERLLSAMPHISWPMRFVLPYHRGLRSPWLIRLGLFIYDHLGGRKILPATRTLNLRTHPTGAALRSNFAKGFEYSDGWVQDARLVALNARDAADRGAEILTRTRVTGAVREGGLWRITVKDTETGKSRKIDARALVNAGGPWVVELIADTLGITSPEKVRLVRGSHIVTRRLFEHDQPYIFQGSDGRVVFAIPYEDDFTLIGTTESEHVGPPGQAECSTEEIEYLCNFVSEYFRKPVTPDDVVWTYSGVRPLYDDGASSATEATREYVLSLDAGDGAPLLNVFGGKITTYRRLAEVALKKLSRVMTVPGADWTAGVPLAGGDFAVGQVEHLTDDLQRAYPFLSLAWARRMIRTYGTEARDILGAAKSPTDLGQDFGATLHEAEVRWLMSKEFARTAQDVLWRRTKLGLWMGEAEAKILDEWMRAELKIQEQVR
ncbi:glycerol-3-phosphate dehydrogenase [Rhodobacteraceae bacterium R_SAG10]|jgi:glycerol-3-phosphate dehydrogenase|nr:glycerol-3-phosphate dehydrogenase [Rhodobacteraceae bacterium R_SAG10]